MLYSFVSADRRATARTTTSLSHAAIRQKKCGEGYLSSLVLCQSLQLCICLQLCGREQMRHYCTQEHSPRMRRELLTSVQGPKCEGHLGTNLLRTWDDDRFCDSDAHYVSSGVSLWSYPHKTILVHFSVLS